MSINFESSALCGCQPTQIVTFNLAINNVEKITVSNSCDVIYQPSNLEYSYSVDQVCWSCYMSYSDLLANTIDLNSDFYLRFKVPGDIGNITLDDENFTDYSTQLDSAFSFSYCETNQNVYNPYANMDGAVQLYQNLSNTVSCIVGIPIYYFKLAPNVGSRDLTFKEYTLMDVQAVKQIKLMIADGQMPSSKPEISDFGLEWQTDWTTEIVKSQFATAFGVTAQPMEGDLIYVPMMKRMWMVNEAYEEKKDAFMWVATTFKVSLVKYQEKGSVNLGDTENLVNSFVKNKYDDLFGDNDESTRGSGEEFNTSPISNNDNLYPIYESDAQRKYVSVDGIDIKDDSTYYRGTVISDKCYVYNNMTLGKKVVYQNKYCGTDGTLSFIIRSMGYQNYRGALLSIGKLKIEIQQDMNGMTLKVNKSSKLKLKLEHQSTYFVFLRWSKELKIVEFSSAKYSWPDNIPLYKLQSGNYYYDIDNMQTTTDHWSIEYSSTTRNEVILNGFIGNITNIKLFDIYDDNISEILQMYPTNNHLLINDTARNILGMNGINIK